jgi:methionyl-tRNA formyltransferase
MSLAASTRLVFMGSPAFAAPSLRALCTAGYGVTLAITQPDRPAGRGGRMTAPAVKSAALELGVPVFQPETLKDEAARERIIAERADVIAVAAYGKILPRAILEAGRRGCLNVHASLLPRWRGASPIAAAVRDGDAETGVTIMEMAARMDAGPIVSQRRVPLGAKDTAGSLEPRLAELGASLLVETMPSWLDGSAKAAPQDEALATYCWTLSKEDGHLAVAMTADEAERAVRAFDPWPGAFVLYAGARLAIWGARVVAGAEAETPGTMRVANGCPAVAFNGGWLLLEEVQKPGGKRISGQQFLNGERGRLEPRCALRA